MYSEKVMDHFMNPRNVGEIENASGVGTVGNAKCGDIMRMYLDIDDNGIIQDVKFKTFGCGAAVATSSMATELVKGKTIQQALEVTNKAVMEALDGLPPVKVHCSLLAEEAIHAALWDYAEKHNIKIEGLEKPVNDISEKEEEEEVVAEHKKYAIITVAPGKGIDAMFKELRADIVVGGGQTMNPSTEDFVSAIGKVNADHTYIERCPGIRGDRPGYAFDRFCPCTRLQERQARLRDLQLRAVYSMAGRSPGALLQYARRPGPGPAGDHPGGAAKRGRGIRRLFGRSGR